MMLKRNPVLVAGFAVSAFVFMIALVLSMSASVVLAQGEPTATPRDPSWLGFSAARDAIEEKKGVDLTLVKSWEFEQTEFVDGIDTGCVTLDEGVFSRRVYFGWVYTITDLRGNVYQARVSFDTKDVAVCDQVTTAEQPSSPDTGELPPPVAGSAVTGGFELGGQALQLNGNTISLMKRAGMTWVKQQIRYHPGDAPGVAQGAISGGKAAGFKVLLSVLGNASDMGDFNSYLQGYTSFIGGVAGLGADAIEVWNEANIDREWPAASINGAMYTQMLASAYNAIKSNNPNTIVISGAPAPTGFFGAAGCGSGGCNDDVFMQQMASAGAAQYLDCVGLHYNEGIIPPTQVGGDPRGEYPTYYFDTMLARGYNPFGGKPACFTELGYVSGEGFSTAIPANFAWANDTSVAEQAAWLAQAATRAAQSGKVRLMIVFNVDFPSFTSGDPQGGYAMFRPDGTCPACDTLGAVMGAGS